MKYLKILEEEIKDYSENSGMLKTLVGVVKKPLDDLR